MHRTKKQRGRSHAILKRVLAIVAMVTILAGVLTLSVFAQNNYVITDGDSVTVHKSFSSDPDVVLNEAGIELSKEDTYTTAYNDGVNRIDIQRMQMVTVINRGSESVVGTYGETVAELLRRAGITLGINDILSHEAGQLTFDGMLLEVTHRESKRIEYDETIPFETKYYEDPELAPDEAIVLIEGAEGVIHYKANAIFENGVEVSREVTEQTVTAEPVTRLIVHGINRTIDDQPKEPERLPMQPLSSTPSAPPTSDNGIGKSNDSINGNVITTATGTTYTYTDSLTVTATAYSCEGYTGYTYSGTVARVGAIAVDPNVIPIGTKMYVVSNDGQYVYGYCVAEDTGGLIKGYRIDLYFDTIDECWGFGVRTCTVYILG